MPSNNPPIDIEELLARKDICLITRQISDTTHNLVTSTTPLPKDHLVVDREKRQIKIGDGENPWSNTRQHTHDDQYSPIVHGHYFGYGEKWFRSCPRLWNKKDLINHPELIPCDGRMVDTEIAMFLEDVYSGTTIGNITDIPSINTDDYRINVYYVGGEVVYDDGYKVFFPPDSLVVKDYDDEFRVEIDSLNTEMIFEWEFKNDVMKPASYSIVSIQGLTTLSTVLGPKSWVLEACTEDDPDTWIELHSDSTDVVWTSSSKQTINLDGDITNTYYLRYRLRVTEWFYDGDSPSLVFPIEAGLRRFQVTGKLFNKFKMPYVPSPSPEFVYVVPMKDMEIGMKHEEVGDIGYTSAYNLTTPVNRLPLDGRALSITEEQHLYGVCGQRYSPVIKTTFDDITFYNDILVEFTDNRILGKLVMESTIGAYPLSFVVSALIDDTWSIIDTVQYSDIPTDYTYHLSPSDKTSDKYKITVITWSEALTGNPFTLSIDWCGSPADTFYIPLVTNSGLNDRHITPYIVTKVRTEDINSSIVLELQAALIESQRQIVELTRRLVEAEVAIQNLVAEPDQ